MTADTPQLLYVYGVVRAGFAAADAPSGMEGAPVETLIEGDIAALLSRVPRAGYAPAVLERQSGDVQWLTPRAEAHDRVLSWAQELGGVLPLAMFSLWGSEEAVRTMLRERTPEMTRTFSRVAGADEFGLRVHRRDADLLRSLHEVDPAIATLRAAADAAAPGQRYLLERKIAEQGKAALRAAGQRMAQAIFDALRPLARDAVARPVGSAAGAAEATIVLNGAFLVERARLDAFRAAVATQVAAHEPRGLSFTFTGPWPPYNFVT